MSNKRIRDIRNLSRDELLTKIRETEKGIFQDRMKLVTAQLDNFSGIWLKRKEIARMKTVLTEMNKKEAAQTTSSV